MRIGVCEIGLGEVLREWGRIGVVGFGGPAAHVALLRDLVVERRGWLDAREFEDANAACGLLPGPASTQLAIYCAGRVAGLRGAVVGGLAFVLPGLALIVLLAAASLGEAPPAWLLAVAAGAGAAVVPVVVAAGVGLGRAAVAGMRGARLARAAAYMAAGAAVAALAGALVVLVLLACGALELAVRRGIRSRPAAVAWPVPALALRLATTSELPALAWTALKVGVLSFGGGLVIVPLMQGDAVEAHGWMTEAQFLNAVAFGQLTPGPVVQTVAVVGYAAAGLGGALLAAAVAFAPSFLVVALTGARFQALRASTSARAFLDGAGPAAVGAIVGAAVPLAAGISEPWQAAVAAAAAAALVARRAPVAVLAAGAALGGVAALFDAPIPGAG
jgi:chromate transporter